MKLSLLMVCLSAVSAFKLGANAVPKAQLVKASAAVTAAAITVHSEAAHAKSILGVNGALDFGPLSGDQPGGEGTGKALGINDDSLGFVLITVVLVIGFLFCQWQGYQDDAEDDFFDTYDSRRVDRSAGDPSVTR